MPTEAPTTTTTDPYAVPEVIDVAYVDGVLAALDAAHGDILRLFARDRLITPEVADRLAAIYTKPEPYDLVVFELVNATSLQFPASVGNQITKVSRLITATPTCVFVESRLDLRPVGAVDLYDLPNWVGLAKTSSTSSYNPTAWMITVDGVSVDGGQPVNPCVAR